MTETLGGGLTDIDGCVDVISAFRAHYIDAANCLSRRDTASENQTRRSIARQCPDIHTWPV